MESATCDTLTVIAMTKYVKSALTHVQYKLGIFWLIIQ